MPGASPETMAATVATPLERHLGTIAGVTEMTSRSNVNNTQIVLQFDIDRDIDGAARDVQAAINAARAGPAGRAQDQSHLPQVQSGGSAGHYPGADLQDAVARADL